MNGGHLLRLRCIILIVNAARLGVDQVAGDVRVQKAAMAAGIVAEEVERGLEIGATMAARIVQVGCSGIVERIRRRILVVGGLIVVDRADVLLLLYLVMCWRSR